MVKYTDDEIGLVIAAKNNNLSWQDISIVFEKKFGMFKNLSALKKIYTEYNYCFKQNKQGKYIRIRSVKDKTKPEQLALLKIYENIKK